jgi:integrase
MKKDSPYWWIQYFVDGQAQRESSKIPRTQSDREAWALLARRQAAIAEGRPTGREGEKLTLANLREILQEDYTQRERKSWDRASRALAAIEAVFGAKTKVSRLTADRLHQYLAARLNDGASRSTVQKELAALKRALALAVERGLLPFRVTFPRIGEIKNARCEFIEAWEWALLRPELPEYWQDLGDMALAMGWRCKGELRPLTWAQVDWERGLVRLEKYRTKNDDARVFPFREAPTVFAALERRRATVQAMEQGTGTPILTVFAVEKRAKLTESRFYRDWRAGWRKAFGKDSAPKRPHDFRRSAVRALETGGVPRSIAKRLVGHRTDSMYQRYAITTEDDLRAAVRQLHQPAPAESE